MARTALLVGAWSGCATSPTHPDQPRTQHRATAAGVDRRVAELNAHAQPTRGGSSAVPAVKPAANSQAIVLGRDVLDQVVATVAKVRRLPLGEPFFIEQIGTQDFKVRAKRSGPKPTTGSKELTQLLKLVPAGEVSHQKSRDQGKVVAYYHARSDTVVLPTTSVARREQDLATFAHEVQHALQHRHFPIVETKKKSHDADASLAFKALVEGDAQVTMAAYRGFVHGIPLGRALRRMTDLVAGTPVHAHRDGRLLSGFDGSSARLFPYQEGARFVTDLYRTGGFDLVNKAYGVPPTSTMHILHPERYLAGELSAVVTLPKTGFGMLVRTGVWGELRTKEMFEQCVGPTNAALLAAHWRGDAFRMSRRSESNAATFEWVSVWSDQDTAIAAGKALRSGPCTSPAIGDGAHRSTRMVQRGKNGTLVRSQSGQAGTQSLLVSVSGKRLVFLRGAVTQAEALAASVQLAQSTVRTRRRAVISAVPIPPRVVVPKPGHGRIHGLHYDNYWLGVQSHWPKGSRANVDGHLLSVGLPTGGLGLLTLFDHVPSGRSLEAIYQDLKREIGGATAVSMTENRAARNRIKTHLGYSLRRRYSANDRAGRAFEVLVDVIPICASTGAIIVARVSGDKRAGARLDTWFGNTRLIAGRRLPACRWLDPK